ncbi:substrate-binding domain-containing protein [Caproiciproducens galactitolivorans]|uniref:D-ribose-binding periplasmic protein n=1 Tax=Caproiciproducens galactitolivorans TaxID=642589 RepID=A0A4Z0Y0H8_9FIRM|nr:substrate-binding domain-containing protein [Caproiciproducens galactitolivorans]TGJ77254.1 D-ribose-binding periplasmic protein precursor [Caproiciproducens galactitolivorans]
MKKLLAAILTVIMAGSMVTGCASSSTASSSGGASAQPTATSHASGKKTFKIGFAQKTLENEFQTALANGLVEAGKAKGFEVTVLDAKNKIENEQKNMETFISQHYDLIFINVVDTQAATLSIEEATNAGIPVIGIDSHVDKSAPVVTSISAPDRANGRVVGLYGAKQYDKATKISAALLSGNKGNPGGQDRRVGLFCGFLEGRIGCTEEEAWKLAEAFEQQLTDKGKAFNEKANFEVVAQGWGNWTTDEGLPAMEDILVANPNINCTIGENDSMLIGAKKAIENAGKLNQIKIFAAADGMKGALELIKQDSAYKATGLNSPTLVAKKGIEVAAKLLVEGADKKSFGATVNTDPVCINKDNVGTFYDPNAIF